MASAGIYDVRDFGAKGDALADDTAAIQAAIDAAIGDGDPATVGRLAKGTVHLPAGIHRITKPLRIASVSYLTFRGEGKATRLCPIGAMDSVLDLNGTAYCTFADLLIEGNTESGRVENVVYTYFDPQTAARTTTGCVFRNIQVQNVPFVAGFRVGKPGSNAQVDTDTFENVAVIGGWKDGEADLYQAGFAVGSGTFGNNLCHSFANPIATHCRYGFNVAATNFLLNGGSFGANGTDFRADTLCYFSVHGIRSEDSQRLLEAGVGPNQMVATISLSDVVFEGTKLHPDKRIITSYYNGNLSLRNLQFGSGVLNPKVFFAPFVAGTLRVDGMVCYGSLATMLADNWPQARVVASGFIERSPSGLTTSVASTQGLLTTAPLRFGASGTGVIDGSSGPIQLNVEAGSSQSGTWFGNGKGDVTGLITGDGAWMFVHIPDAKAPNQSIFLGAEHNGLPCYRDRNGDVFTLDLTKAKKGK